MKKQETIVITAFHGLISKNILNSGVLEGMLKDPSCRIVLAVPEIKADFFRGIYKDPRIAVAGFDVRSIIGRRWPGFFSRIAFLLVDSHYLWYKKVERRDSSPSFGTRLKYGSEILFTKLFAGIPFFRRLFRRAYRAFPAVPEIAAFYENCHPSKVFATDAFDEMDSLFEREAVRAGIPLVSMVRSWDNCYSKGIMRVLPGLLIVNNETILDEASSLHDVPAERIAVCGVPQYDVFLNGARSCREDFFRRIGADPSRKLVLFAPAGSILSESDGQILEILKRAMDSGAFPFPVHILVRNHPHHPAELSAFSGAPGITVETPGRSFSRNGKESELVRADIDHLADSLWHASVIVYVATTLGLDGIVYDKPQVVVNFDGFEDLPYSRSVKRYHEEDHMKKMLDLGGAAIADGALELVAEVSAYLKDPSKDREGRRKILGQQLWNADGKSAGRVAKAVLDFPGRPDAL